MQSYDPATGDGVVMDDVKFVEYELAVDALAGSVFRMLRQGQRVLFELDDDELATTIRLGSGTLAAWCSVPLLPPPGRRRLRAGADLGQRSLH